VSRGYRFRPVGVVRSEVKTIEEAQKQGAIAGMEAEIVPDPACTPAPDIKPHTPERDG
jgi:tRNA (Thr-GGU) A37 N-methylase